MIEQLMNTGMLWMRYLASISPISICNEPRPELASAASSRCSPSRLEMCCSSRVRTWASSWAFAAAAAAGMLARVRFQMKISCSRAVRGRTVSKSPRYCSLMKYQHAMPARMVAGAMWRVNSTIVIPWRLTSLSEISSTFGGLPTGVEVPPMLAKMISAMSRGTGDMEST
eukprot:Amastigsp_a678637_19.p2 type:complete len:170 gc:universal Amastigsp_a678637_19:1647-1138(-)